MAKRADGGTAAGPKRKPGAEMAAGPAAFVGGDRSAAAARSADAERGRPAPVTTATGSCEVPESRQQVWHMLTAFELYCPVCDVSYRILQATGGKGTTFVCVPGRLDDRIAPSDAPRAEIIEWMALRLLTTRLELTSETWTTKVRLADTSTRGTHVTFTVTHQPRGGSRLAHRLQRSSLQRLVQGTVDAELAKIPAHLALPRPGLPSP